MLLLICRNFLYILGQSPLSDICITNVSMKLAGSLASADPGLFSVNWTEIELKPLGAACLVRKSAQTALISYPHQRVLPLRNHSEILSQALSISGGCYYV